MSSSSTPRLPTFFLKQESKKHTWNIFTLYTSSTQVVDMLSAQLLWANTYHLPCLRKAVPFVHRDAFWKDTSCCGSHRESASFLFCFDLFSYFFRFDLSSKHNLNMQKTCCLFAFGRRVALCVQWHEPRFILMIVVRHWSSVLFLINDSFPIIPELLIWYDDMIFYEKNVHKFKYCIFFHGKTMDGQ